MTKTREAARLRVWIYVHRFIKGSSGRHKVLYTETKSSVDASVHTKETNTSISAYPLHILYVIQSKTN